MKPHILRLMFEITPKIIQCKDIRFTWKDSKMVKKGKVVQESARILVLSNVYGMNHRLHVLLQNGERLAFPMTPPSRRYLLDVKII